MMNDQNITPDFEKLEYDEHVVAILVQHQLITVSMPETKICTIAMGKVDLEIKAV